MERLLFYLSYSQETRDMYETISHQVDVVKDEGGFVHLAQDQQHLIVDELFVLFQVTVHVLFHLCADLPKKLHRICWCLSVSGKGSL